MHFRFTRRYFSAALIALAAMTAVALPVSAQSAGLPVIHVEHGPNSAAALKQHYVVLVSLDGFRWDYPALYGAPNLLALGKEGVRAPQACYQACLIYTYTSPPDKPSRPISG